MAFFIGVSLLFRFEKSNSPNSPAPFAVRVFGLKALSGVLSKASAFARFVRARKAHNSACSAPLSILRQSDYDRVLGSIFITSLSIV
jgi:hypothetical protein